MKILVINAGSSSMKYQLIDMNGERMLAKGNCERIGIDGKFTHKTADGRGFKKKDVAMPDHTAAFGQIKAMLTDPEYGVISDFSEISAVGVSSVATYWPSRMTVMRSVMRLSSSMRWEI